MRLTGFGLQMRRLVGISPNVVGCLRHPTLEEWGFAILRGGRFSDLICIIMVINVLIERITRDSDFIDCGYAIASIDKLNGSV